MRPHGESLREREHPARCLPSDLIGRIERFGGTAVPGLAAKPVIDMLVQVADLRETRRRIAPLLESRGHDYFWRPTSGDSAPPFYAWFIKRDGSGARTHHIHMVESHFEHWNRLLFRDWLTDHPGDTARYGRLKMEPARRYGSDRLAYTRARGAFISEIMERARGSRVGGERISMVFREIVRSDVPALFRVRVSTRENVLTGEDLQRLGITEQTVCGMLGSSHRGWLCEEDGVVVGFAMGNGRTGEMWVIALLPEAEGRGIGSELMDRVEVWFWSLGWREIWLTTDTDTSLRAYGFYRARGWEDWKVENGDLFMRRENPFLETTEEDV